MSEHKKEWATGLSRKDASQYVSWIVQMWRAEFDAGERQDCVVCGKYKSVCHAHHIYPLAWQARAGVASPNHDFVWLCPTHHAYVHLILSEYRMQRNIIVPPEEASGVVKIAVRGLKVAGRLS